MRVVKPTYQPIYQRMTKLNHDSSYLPLFFRSPNKNLLLYPRKGQTHAEVLYITAKAVVEMSIGDCFRPPQRSLNVSDQ